MDRTIKRSRSRMRKQEERAAYILLFPSIVGLSFITYIPLLAVFILAFFSWKGFGPITFVGMDNYVRLFTRDPYFYDSIKATVSYALMAVIGSMVWSLMVALMLNRKIPARGFFRAAFYLPYVLPAMAVYLGWSWLYDYNHGLLNFFSTQLGGGRIMFLDSANIVIPSLALIAVWLAGNLIVIYLAGLQNVPRTYYEAAQIDGANSWQRFWSITIPCMTPIIFYNLLMSLVANLQVVTPALALTNGGPGKSTTFLSFLLYRNAFINSRLGYACAIASFFFVLIAIFTGILFATSKHWIFYMGDDRQ
ncbi:MAG: sugar ABC transporter permease [Eubacteriales bacterium]|jgi:multiple sugar transport system permease protein|nr:sugar ABC transporter permease [Eubacteriales bacterium]MDD4105174.1 sugar ABC transporter permease [Eubacteriales bacterium]MDD4710771.1 sugar ABC transporter permease [Eubacteriales bacterium]NLO14775.1 sugar ABC transporter permease [Clostridiales bacterium]